MTCRIVSTSASVPRLRPPRFRSVSRDPGPDHPARANLDTTTAGCHRMPAALAGITVLDFTRLLPGPFCTQLLCNPGEAVIKIEDPKLGDYMRAVPALGHAVSIPFPMA